MSSITGIDNTAISAASTNSTTNISGQLTKYDFLKILAAELQNQDPTDPLDNKDFIAQLASFSTLEQMQNMSTSFETLGENLQIYMENQASANQAMLVTQSATLIGKNVVTDVDGNEIEGIVESIFIEDSIPYAMIGGESVPVSSITKIFAEENENQVQEVI